jgi:hypothetical protein
MICNSILRGHYFLVEGQYSEHDEKINGNQQELNYLVINFMRKIARHAVTVYSGSAGRSPTSG